MTDEFRSYQEIVATMDSGTIRIVGNMENGALTVIHRSTDDQISIGEYSVADTINVIVACIRDISRTAETDDDRLKLTESVNHSINVGRTMRSAMDAAQQRAKENGIPKDAH